MDGQSDLDAVAGAFERRRPRLQALAHRMLGSESEAQDAVQEAWIRLSRSDVDAVDNLDGWLTTVVARVCLDALRSRRARREDSLDDALDQFGADLPVLRRDDDARHDDVRRGDPAEQALQADAVGVALLVVLDRLSPAERLAFVLHDMFGVPFEEIAPIVQRSPDAAKMLASRARRRVRGAGSDELGATQQDGAAVARQRDVVNAYLAASRSGDIGRLIALLDPQVELRVDLGGSTERLIRGARNVAGQAVSYRARSAQRILVDGLPGLLAVEDGRAAAVLTFEVADGLVIALHVLADPVALARLDLGDFPDLG